MYDQIEDGLSPDSFPALLSLKFLVGSVVGGIVSISGVFVGALFIEFTPNFADQISKAAPDAIFGMFLIALMYLMPKGAIGVLGFLRARFRQVAVAKNILLEPTGNLAENGEGFRRRGAKRSQGAARISKE